jgi:serine phosphatase RsbU (regulator of sigma subunit)
MLEENGLILGVMEDYEYKTYSREINPGDYILMYTDGLLEPKEEGNDMRNCNDFLDYIDRHKDMVKGDPALLLDSIVKDFGKDSVERLRDDVAVIVVKIK